MKESINNSKKRTSLQQGCTKQYHINKFVQHIQGKNHNHNSILRKNHREKPTYFDKKQIDSDEDQLNQRSSPAQLKSILKKSSSSNTLKSTKKILNNSQKCTTINNNLTQQTKKSNNIKIQIFQPQRNQREPRISIMKAISKQNIQTQQQIGSNRNNGRTNQLFQILQQIEETSKMHISSDIQSLSKNTDKMVDILQFLGLQNSINLSIPENINIQCLVKRQKFECLGNNYLYHFYEVNSFKYLLTAEYNQGKYSLFKYINGERFLYGYIKNNFFGTEYRCYRSAKNNYTTTQLIQQIQFINIQYENNIFGLKGPRKMNVYIPEDDQLLNFTRQTPLSKSFNEQKRNIKKYINKQPKWNKQTQSYNLNFKGRIKLQSVKNFILMPYNDSRPKVCFRKVSVNLYHLQIAHPFTLLQAAAIAISTFDKKVFS